jgi:uncharacterized membrane protein
MGINEAEDGVILVKGTVIKAAEDVEGIIIDAVETVDVGWINHFISMQCVYWNVWFIDSSYFVIGLILLCILVLVVRAQNFNRRRKNEFNEFVQYVASM